MSDTLLRVEGLKKFFHVRRGFPVTKTVTVRAVDGISFEVKRGRSFGLVGESGCGKSTVGRSLLRLTEPDSGSVTFDGQDVLSTDSSAMRALRQRMQIIFQDPYSSLNPRKRIGAALAEPLLVHGLADRRQAHEQVLKLLDEVGLAPDAANRFPHEFSGGQRQRIGIARALTVGPDLIVADEPVSALDVSIQAQILLLLRQLQESHNLGFSLDWHPPAWHAGTGVFIKGSSNSSAKLNPVETDLSVGLVLTGIFQGRPDDILGIGVGFIEIRQDSDFGVFPEDTEGSFEIFYRFTSEGGNFQVTPHIMVVSDAGGGLGWIDDTLTILGLRFMAKF